MLVYIFHDRLAYFITIWYILWLFGLFNGHLVYFKAIWYIFPRFGILFPVLVYCIKKNLATPSRRRREKEEQKKVGTKNGWMAVEAAASVENRSTTNFSEA
jgi:hypothetical protein